MLIRTQLNISIRDGYNVIQLDAVFAKKNFSTGIIGYIFFLSYRALASNRQISS